VSVHVSEVWTPQGYESMGINYDLQMICKRPKILSLSLPVLGVPNFCCVASFEMSTLRAE